MADNSLTVEAKSKIFCFTVDDNIRFLKELNERSYPDIFSHPYLRTYRRLHEKYDLKVQLNLFYEADDFNLSQMTDNYRDEWLQNSDWLKLSFHSRLEAVKPYESSGYEEVFEDCQKVHREIIRFASLPSLAKTTTIHYCLATSEGLSALKDNGVLGLLGLYGTPEKPCFSYQSTPAECIMLSGGQVISSENMMYSSIDIVLNRHKECEISRLLDELSERDFIKVMIHEQYFYLDYARYQPSFEEKLNITFSFLRKNGYESIFFEDLLP